MWLENLKAIVCSWVAAMKTILFRQSVMRSSSQDWRNKLAFHVQSERTSFLSLLKPSNRMLPHVNLGGGLRQVPWSLRHRKLLQACVHHIYWVSMCWRLAVSVCRNLLPVTTNLYEVTILYIYKLYSHEQTKYIKLPQNIHSAVT